MFNSTWVVPVSDQVASSVAAIASSAAKTSPGEIKSGINHLYRAELNDIGKNSCHQASPPAARLQPFRLIIPW